MKVSIQVAEANLSDLIDAAIAGEDVFIDKGGDPIVRVVAIERRKFQIGVLQGHVGTGPNFLDPMSEDELRTWEGVA